jgi:rfaE bifunctional protein nucleotidyltransferase chain/domain
VVSLFRPPQKSCSLKNIMQKGLVLVPGCFDLLHAEQIRFLEEARKHGKVLAVALPTDSSVRIIKGPGRPLVPYPQRCYCLESLRVVDFVIAQDELTPCEIIRFLQPEVVAKGGDWQNGRHLPEANEVEKYGGRLVFVGPDFRNHTTDLIKKIKEIP